MERKKNETADVSTDLLVGECDSLDYFDIPNYYEIPKDWGMQEDKPIKSTKPRQPSISKNDLINAQKDKMLEQSMKLNDQAFELIDKLKSENKNLTHTNDRQRLEIFGLNLSLINQNQIPTYNNLFYTNQYPIPISPKVINETKCIEDADLEPF